MPQPPAPAEPLVIPLSTDRPFANRLLLQQREKDFRDSLERLSDGVSKLRENVSQMPFSQVFSVQVYKQTEAIEHLAKRLKNLAKS